MEEKEKAVQENRNSTEEKTIVKNEGYQRTELKEGMNLEIEFIDLEAKDDLQEIVSKEKKAEDTPVFQTGFQEKEESQFQKKIKKSMWDIPEWTWFALGIILDIGLILAGIFLCKEPLLTVLLVVGIESALAICLSKAPFWIHGMVVVANIILGVMFQMWFFMLVVSIIYAIGILLIYKHEGIIGGF